uniref:Uncharacterized protein n=1 Tax=Anolis carolinensis TaxID=28377 RepID=A0A803T3S7_ANOCA
MAQPLSLEAHGNTISHLWCQLKEAEEERRKAAQYGLKLMENENLLQNRLDELQNEMVVLTENFEQEKYTLQSEVELKNRMLGSLNHGYETLKQQQNAQLDVLCEQLERAQGQEMNELKNKVERLKSELDERLPFCISNSQHSLGEPDGQEDGLWEETRRRQTGQCIQDCKTSVNYSLTSGIIITSQPLA